MSYITNQTVSLAQSSQLDSYSRLRTTEIDTIFDSPLKYHDEGLLWDTVLNGSATSVYNLTETLLDMGVTGTGDSVIRQSKEYFQLQSGKSHQGLVGFVFGIDNTNVTKKVGFYDNSDGFYLQYVNGQASFVERTSVSGTTVETAIPRNEWLDPMDGTGRSGINIDFTKSQVLSFDISFTGFGRVRAGVLIDGEVHNFVELEKANTTYTNGFSTPSLPIRYELTSGGGSATMKQQASCVLVEGRNEPRGIVRTVDTGNTAVSIADGVGSAVISVRLKSEYRKAKILPESFQIMHTSGNSSVKYEIFFYCDVTGGTWSSVDPQSIAEVNYSATSHSGGVKVASGYLPSKSSMPVNEEFNSILTLTGNYDGSTHTMTIVLTGLGNSAPAYASLSFKEIY